MVHALLGDRAAPASHRVSAVGHAHLDTAWLWPLRETVRKCARTFSTVLALMDRYPDYHFVVSQAQHLAWMRDHYPGLWSRLKVRIAEGRLEPTGSMWVEADCNIPSGESLVRQIIHGKRFYLDELGIETDDVWLPDVFGYSAALPQIMRLGAPAGSSPRSCRGTSTTTCPTTASTGRASTGPGSSPTSLRPTPTAAR